MKHALVLGGGFAGATAAYMLKNKGFEVTLIEKTNEIGGGIRTRFYRGHPYTWGPRHINCEKQFVEAWEFFNKEMDIRLLDHKIMTLSAIEDDFFEFPPKWADIPKMKHKDKILEELDDRDFDKIPESFEDHWVSSVGPTLYDSFIKTYSHKMWGINDNTELEYFHLPVRKNVPREEGVDFFYGKQWCAYPKNIDAFNPFLDRSVDGCNVLLNTIAEDYDIPNKKVKVKGNWIKPDIIINTISLDTLFDNMYGELKYRGRDFIKIILPIERITPEGFYFMHYAGKEEPYTRIFEYKMLTGYKSKNTLIGIEIPSNNNKLYPYPIPSEIEKHKKYKKHLPEDVYTLGRMGEYKYRCMAEIVHESIQLMKEI